MLEEGNGFGAEEYVSSGNVVRVRLTGDFVRDVLTIARELLEMRSMSGRLSGWDLYVRSGGEVK